jgi:F-type H+-transporting ATPase subunit b
MKELGIEPILLLAQIVNFGIVFFVLKKYLYKPLLAMLDKRKHEIEEGLISAQKAAKQEEKLKEKEADLLLSAKKDAKAVVDQAKKQLEEQKKQILADAHKQAAEILAKAKVQAENVAKSQEESMKNEAVELAIAMVAKVLPDVLSEGDHRKILSAKLKDIEKATKSIHSYESN